MLLEGRFITNFHTTPLSTRSMGKKQRHIRIRNDIPPYMGEREEKGSAVN